MRQLEVKEVVPEHCRGCFHYFVVNSSSLTRALRMRQGMNWQWKINSLKGTPSARERINKDYI